MIIQNLEIRKYLKVILLLLSLITVSCGEDVEERIDTSIDEALSYLAAGSCQEAIDALESSGFYSHHAVWLKTLASSYMCRAGYATPTLVSELLTSSPVVFGSPSTLGGLTRIASSRITNNVDEDESFVDLQYAIDLLLYAGGTPRAWDPTVARRANNFAAEEALDINSQLLFMIMAQMGKYFYRYGNASSAGVKGAGTQGNLCLVNYQNIGSIDATLGALPGSCNSFNSGGHTDLGLTGNLSIPKLCRGVTLFNNFITIFPSVLAAAGGSDELTVLNGAEALVDGARLALIIAEPTAVAVSEVLSYQKCIDDNLTSDNLEYMFVHLFETLFE